MTSNRNTGQSTSQDNPPSSTGSLGKRKAGEQASQNPSSSSPRKAGSTSAPPPSLHAARDELVKNYTSIPEKPVADFVRDHVPKVAQHVVDRVLEKLKGVVEIPKERDTRAGTSTKHTALTEDGMVWGYGKTGQNTPARKSSQSESSAFHCLCVLINATIELAARLNGRSWVAHSSRQDKISGEKPNSSRPDSFLHLVPKLTEDLGWEQLLCVGEFKKHDDYETRLDDWAKILWGMHHIMRNDPCRLFTFGYTMEDNKARLWYHARSSVFVSESFDWIKDPEPFVKFILGLALTKPEHFQQAPAPIAPVNFGVYDAPPEKAQGIDVLYANRGYLERIGIDATMKRVSADKKIQYEITVAGEVFVTEKVLCDFKADHATGRTTRVWVVYIKGSNGSVKYVLKDVWLEEGAKVEGDKLDELEKKIKADEDAGTIGDHGAADVKQWYQDHFLHKHTHEKLDQNVPGAQGEYSSICVVRDPTVGRDVSSIHSGSQRVATQGGPLPVPPQRRKEVFDDPARFHYRIVYKGKMTPLESVSCRKTSAQVVIGVLRACWVLWIYKRVHRDVSSWNVFWDPIAKTGRLGDFDYLNVYGESGTGTTKTGTPHFWSVEVEANGHLYRKQLPLEDDEDDAAMDALLESDLPLFQHSVLHDLESVFWISLWTFLYLIGKEDRDDGLVNDKRQRLYREIFPEDNPSKVQLARRDFLHGVGDLSSGTLWQKYQVGIHDDTVRRAIRTHLLTIRPTVVKHFELAEKEIGPSSFIDYTHVQFVEALTDLHKRMLDVEFKLGPNYGTFPVTPLRLHKYVLTDEPGPYELERWPDAADTEEDQGDQDDEEEPDAAPRPSRTSAKKRQKMNA